MISLDQQNYVFFKFKGALDQETVLDRFCLYLKSRTRLKIDAQMQIYRQTDDTAILTFDKLFSEIKIQETFSKKFSVKEVFSENLVFINTFILKLLYVSNAEERKAENKISKF